MRMNMGIFMYLLFLAWTQLSWCIQQASRASHGFSPGHPLYKIPQYLPYLRNGAADDGERIDKKKKED
jgi:hypothetical protein